ncbi:PRC-barrel domain-containing protein [Cryptosporangium sp. NPDC048952]|uniref:PRC-barrel domain-containing protein n=1 Tax=Cryptosporangium sp. NPDC048952 TaxID=3363961 RepID=UPI003712D5AD
MRVRDRDGEKIGKVDDLLVDADERRVRFLRVESGGILGFGATPSFVPAEAVTRIDEDVHVDQSGKAVADAPAYDPELTDDIGCCSNLYGYSPFWGPARSARRIRCCPNDDADGLLAPGEGGSRAWT